MCIAMARCTRLMRGVFVHAALQPACLLGVTGRTVDRRRMIWMRIRVDVRVTGSTVQTAVNAGMKQVRIHAHIVPRGILHRYITMTGETVRLRMHQHWPARQQQRCKGR